MSNIMKDVFFFICLVSLVPSVLFGIYLLLMPITEKYCNAKWQFSMLKSMIIMFMIPVYSIVSKLSSSIVKQFNITVPDIFVAKPNVNYPIINTDFSAIDIVEKASNIDFFSLVAILWIVGIIVISIYQIYSYRELVKKTKSLTPATDVQNIIAELKEKLGIKQNVSAFYDNYIDTPMLIGISKPKILLPNKRIDENQLSYILTHELTHLKRKDLWWKLVLQVIAIIHWFNPIVYLFRIEFEKQLEYSCDEMVAENLSFEERRNYGFTILQSVQVTKMVRYSFMGVGFATTKQKLERRIKNMLNLKKMKTSQKILSATLAVFMLTAVAVPAFAKGVDEGKVTNGIISEENGMKTETYSMSIVCTEAEKINLIEAYGEFGITFDENENMQFNMQFNDELVRCFYDGYQIDENTSTTRYEYYNEGGIVDVYTKRDVIDNPDGGINPFGSLISLEKASEEDFNKRDVSELKNSINHYYTEDYSPNATYDATIPHEYVLFEPTENIGEHNSEVFLDDRTFKSLLKRFEPYGVTSDASGYNGNIYYNGTPVARFTDTRPDGGVTMLESDDGGEVDLKAVYDEDGNLTGVEEYLYFEF